MVFSACLPVVEVQQLCFIACLPMKPLTTVERRFQKVLSPSTLKDLRLLTRMAAYGWKWRGDAIDARVVTFPGE